MAGTLYVVATPIGNLEDITLRALRILRGCDLIAAEDTRRTQKLLVSQGLTTRCVSYHQHNSRARLPQLLASLERGLSIALVSDAGTPGISDPGLELVRACVEKQINVEPIPGASAPLTALSVCGFPQEPFSFFGFPPHKSIARATWLRQVFDVRHTFCFLEAPHRVKETLSQASLISGKRPMMLAREMTKIHQQFIRGTAGDILGVIGRPIGEMTIVVGPAVARESPERVVQDESVYAHFLREMDSGQPNRRLALERTASVMCLAKNEVYEIVERLKRGRIESERSDD